MRELRARREALSELVPRAKDRVVAAEARLLVANDAAERAEAGIADAPDVVPEDAWDTILDAVGKGFTAGMHLWVVWPIAIVCVVAYFAVHGIATCGDPHTFVARITGTVLESVRPEVRATAPCVIDARGNLDTHACTATVTCDGRRLYEGAVDCHDDERITGTDSDGDPETESYLVLGGPGVALDLGSNRATAPGPVQILVRTRSLDRSGP